MADKKNMRIKLIIEGIVALFIALSPIVFYAYKYFPPDQEVELFFFKITSNGFYDVRDHLYYFFGKIVPLILLVIWFLTSKQWWYHAILIPIAMYSFQLLNVVLYESGRLDENEILYVVGVTMVITPIVYLARITLVDKYIHGIDLKAMDTELQILKAKEELRKEREKLEKEKKALAKKM